MKSFLKIIIISFFSIIVTNAYSVTIISDGENEMTVNIDLDAGAIIQISEPVSSITSAKNFKIKPVGANSDQKTGLLTDVSEFEVNVLSKKAPKSENVTFILASKRALNFKFIPNKNAEKYYQVKSKQNDISTASNSDIRYDFSNFLSTETKLIKAMLLDSDASFKKTIVNREVDLSPYDKTLSVRLVRVFQGANLFGYTFVFRNLSGKTIYIAPQHLAIGNPNRAIMAQSDRYKLTSCSENQNECVTAVRYVVRDVNYNISNISLETPDPTMPFVISNSNKKGN